MPFFFFFFFLWGAFSTYLACMTCNLCMIPELWQAPAWTALPYVRSLTSNWPQTGSHFKADWPWHALSVQKFLIVCRERRQGKVFSRVPDVRESLPRLRSMRTCNERLLPQYGSSGRHRICMASLTLLSGLCRSRWHRRRHIVPIAPQAGPCRLLLLGQVSWSSRPSAGVRPPCTKAIIMGYKSIQHEVHSSG